jgi:hypothetical protein|tara:strand:+ start:1691 stop:2269 length:579 start_codon:yes stop_codon:yes gene_type:complete
MEEYSQEGVNALAQAGRAIPGQSLTANPDEPRPFEGAPDFTNFKEALDYTAAELLLEENYMPLMMAIGDGVPIVDLATQIGYVGFREGKWNPDLMMMLLEPIMYLLMALAEKAGIKYRIDSEEEDDVSDNEGNKFEQIKNITRNRFPKKSSVTSGSIPKEILDKVEKLEIPSKSLLAKQEEEQPQSLLGRGQ